MIHNFSFAEVKKYLENKSDNTRILEDFNTFADVAIIFTPIVFGPQFLFLLEVLDAKDRLVEAGKKIISFIKSQDAQKYKDRMQQIDSVYVTLSLTAFVEAIKEILPSSDVKEVIRFFKENERFELLISGTEKGEPEKNQTINIMFPNEVDTLDDVKSSLLSLYENACKNIKKHFELILQKLENGEKNSKRIQKTNEKIKNILSELRQIPNRALSIYTAQLIDLMSSFDDFSAYIQLREFTSLKSTLDKSMKQLLTYDVGLKSLADLIKSINKTQKEEEIEKICDDLKKKYNEEIERPIAGNSYDELTSGVTTETEYKDLSFPKIIDAFIPQAYKCLRYTGSLSLENIKVWDEIPTKENIGDFFVNYLSFPHSVEYPLIVLGLPGSGKSILTKVLSAQLMNSSYTIIRIPLRDIDADNDIHVIISEQIAKSIQRPLKDGYAGFAEHFVNNPLFVIFDGYDELLRVKGDVFNGYISKIHEFQKSQSALARPIRVMITSRRTLIDKVKIPINSVIVNLEAFDQSRRNAWITIWNDYNKDYFLRNNIKPFFLKNEEKLSKNVKELAEQPLLLLMLALFDSYENALESMDDNMSRTHLYDELLRRICRREAKKLPHNTTNDSEPLVEKYVEDEMSRLGVVAIGMFNRKIFHIHTKDLLSDLLTYNILNEWGETPKEADSLIRSFFFVHKSEAYNENESKKDYAYEFLHNTFGEFLTANFILNYLVREAAELFYAHQNKMQANIVNKKLYDPNGLGDEWFINLMFAPLYSRPLVIEMIREHLPCVLKRNEFETKSFQVCLIELVEAQLKMFLEEKNIPQIIRYLDGFKDVKLPLIGHISTYTLNITILASLLSEDGFTFDESKYSSDTSQDSETSPWDKLTNLWKTWFSSDNLTGLARIFRSNRQVIDENPKLSIINLNCPARIDDVESDLNGIEKKLTVANALSDQMTLSLCGLQTTRFMEITKKGKEELLSILKSINQDLYTKYIINLIRKELYNPISQNKFREINKLMELILNNGLIDKLNQDVIFELFSVIEIALSYQLVYLNVQKKILILIRYILLNREPKTTFEHSYIDPIFRIEEYLSNILCDIFDNKEINYKKRMRLAHDDIPFLHQSEILFDSHIYRRNIDLRWDKKGPLLLLSEENIIEYMMTNPEMVSYCLLYFKQQRKTSNIEFNNILQLYFDYLYKNIIKSSYKNFSIIHIRTIIYAIYITENINEKKNLQKSLIKILKFAQENFNSEFFIKLFLFSSNELLNIMVEQIPELYNEFVLEYLIHNLEYISEFEFNFDYHERIYLALAYIKIYKYTKIKNNGIGYNYIHMRELNQKIYYIIREFIESNINIFDVLSVNEYDDILWYLEKNLLENNLKNLNVKIIENFKKKRNYQDGV